MDTAVALVQAYLQINGYFTVTEYPVLELLRRGEIRTATDLDVLAFRFSGAGCEIKAHRNRRASGPLAFEPDPELRIPGESADMIVGEVKQGSAHFNSAARDPLVLSAALVRFGCCRRSDVENTVRQLLKDGAAHTPGGHVLRLIAFGSTRDHSSSRYQIITVGHILNFLREHIGKHWEQLGHAQFSQPAMAFLSLIEKAERGDRLQRG